MDIHVQSCCRSYLNIKRSATTTLQAECCIQGSDAFLLQLCRTKHPELNARSVVKNMQYISPSVSYAHSEISHSAHTQSRAGTRDDNDNIQCISQRSSPWSTSTQINCNFEIRQANTVDLGWLSAMSKLRNPRSHFY